MIFYYYFGTGRTEPLQLLYFRSLLLGFLYQLWYLCGLLLTEWPYLECISSCDNQYYI